MSQKKYDIDFKRKSRELLEEKNFPLIERLFESIEKNPELELDFLWAVIYIFQKESKLK